MSNLPIRKLYFDSRFKTSDSKSDTQCKFELNETVDLPSNCYCYLDDVSIPHSFYGISEINNNIFFRQMNVNSSTTDTIITLEKKNYTGTLLASSIKSVLDSAYGNNNYTVVYGERTGKITITSTVSNVTFVILTDKQLSPTNSLSFTVSYDTDNPKSMNDVLRNSGLPTDSSTYESGFLDLNGISNIYISSANIGSHDTIGCKGERNILKKVQVSSSYGFMIFDNVVATHDYFKVSKQMLKTLYFSLKDANGNIINLNGSHWSFSMIFMTQEEANK